MENKEILCAESFNDAVYKAGWLAMGQIGGQRQYELDIYVRDCVTRELRRFDVRVTYSDPAFNVTEVRG